MLAIIWEIELQESNCSGLLDLKYPERSGDKYKNHFIYLDGLGIRDLLIRSGSTMDLEQNENLPTLSPTSTWYWLR